MHSLFSNSIVFLLFRLSIWQRSTNLSANLRWPSQLYVFAFYRTSTSLLITLIGVRCVVLHGSCLLSSSFNFRDSCWDSTARTKKRHAQRHFRRCRRRAFPSSFATVCLTSSPSIRTIFRCTRVQEFGNAELFVYRFVSQEYRVRDVIASGKG